VLFAKRRATASAVGEFDEPDPITATQNGLILEAANPISLCVEFLALWRGNIRPGVGKQPMSRTG
jgi:hypothetical protein